MRAEVLAAARRLLDLKAEEAQVNWPRRSGVTAQIQAARAELVDALAVELLEENGVPTCPTIGS